MVTMTTVMTTTVGEPTVLTYQCQYQYDEDDDQYDEDDDQYDEDDDQYDERRRR
jgi:hypothetical protein